MLAPPAPIVADPAKMAVFRDVATPDPSVYSDWWRTASAQHKRIAVGSRRYVAVKSRLGREPEYEHFIDPATGELLPVADLKAETVRARRERLAKAREVVAHRRELVRTVATYGFVPPAEVPGPVKRR